MKSRFLKAMVLLMTFALCIGSACAEDAVETILNAKTTQAFTQDPVSEDDLTTILQAGTSAANALGYGTKIISSPTMSLNGENHDALCEKLGVDTSLNAVAVLLIGTADNSVDGATGATTRNAIEEKVSFVK